MTNHSNQKVTKFERALQTITLSTWNRQRTPNELQSFLARREAELSDIQL